MVHRWKSEHRPGNAVYLLDNGRLLRVCPVDEPGFSCGGQGGRIQEQAWDGTALWSFDVASPENRQHHDVEPLPNVNVLVIAWEAKTAAEAVMAGRDPSTSDAYPP